VKREGKKGFVAIRIYVDDCLIIGEDAAIECFVSDIKRFYDTTTEDVENFVGCNVEMENNEIHLHQPDLIRKMLKTFGKELETMKDYEIPSSQGYRANAPHTEEEMLSKEDQKKYRSGVGSLLYLVKHSRPDLANATRELSKVMDGANRNHLKAMLRAIKYVEVTKGLRLKMKIDEKEKIWNLKGFCDSDYAGDPDTRKSVSGYIVYLNGCPVTWKSKGQKSVSLSSTEAKYRAISEIATEILLLRSELKFLGFEVELPIIMNVDNVKKSLQQGDE
jgi:hypothetical protein